MTVLTVHDTVHLSTIVEAAIKGQRVARLIPNDENAAGLVIVGTARSVGDERGNHASDKDDVRDCFLRVTTTTGFEAFWPVSKLMHEVQIGSFVTNYQEPS